MADETEGGCYKDVSGEGFHDANGKPVPAPKSAPAKKSAGPVTIETIDVKPLVTTETVEIVDSGTSTVIADNPPKSKGNE